ncbi:MAG: type II toxin-antitoxin system PemK/MazF family toxin, partial [Spirochaetaceae bacterium]|nr:type II toxin-antitoxin system PemK/MazF family toxin [Spirochaetaceae bacterium]
SRRISTMIERYGVYWATLDPVQGSQMSKTRPVVVISDEGMNRFLDTLVVCPLTSRLHPRWPSRIQAMVAGKEVEIAVDQIRTISKARIGERLDRLEEPVAAEIRHLVTEMYGVLSVSS